MRPPRRHHYLLFACTALFFAFVACGEPPSKEMNQAQGAIDAARAAGADQFATGEFKAAVEALDKSRAAVDQRDYRQALAYALDARERAQSAARTAADEKARVRAETDRALHTAELALDRAQASLQEARRLRVPPRLFAASEQTIEKASEATRIARSAMEHDNYLGARQALEGLSQRLDATASEIDAAIAARAPRRPARRQPR
jgi:hypothetical protein